MYKNCAIVYSRMLPKRFPGKAMYKILNKPLLQHVLERVDKIDKSVLTLVATSKNKEDDPIFELTQKLGVLCYRGDHDNVAKRTIQIIEKYGFENIIRVCGDRPLLDPYLQLMALKQMQIYNLDLCTTSFPKILPAGLTTEVFTAQSFLKINSHNSSDYEKEHITSAYYNKKNNLKIKNIDLPNRFIWPSPDNVYYTVDEKRDIEFIEYNLIKTKDEEFGYSYLKKLLELSKNF